MTTLYGTTAVGSENLAGVIGPDASCRPQVIDPAGFNGARLEPEEEKFLALLQAVGKLIGVEALLNTSFNPHGQPIVRTSPDALDAFLETGLDALVADGITLIRKC